MTAKILFLSGSTRQDSLNKTLARAATEIAKAHGASATFADLRDFPMPLYDGDLEAESGLPEAAKDLKKLFVEHDAFFISSPEYNSSFSGVLKNSIDWISRPHEENEAFLKAFTGKVAAIGAASPGALGGLRGLVPLRMLLGNISVLVIPEQLALGNANEKFDSDGNFTDSASQTTVTRIVKRLIDEVENRKHT